MAERPADRVVLHVDMDAFFASVEVLDDPALVGRPVIVGGAGPRGVVAACTYEARRFGVRSAMASSVARRLCPDAVFVAGRYHRYVEESTKLHAIFEDVTPLVEGISLDEAFLDVTGAVRLLGDGPSIAAGIRERVADELRLRCSVGVGRSKLIAKLASKAAKPVADRAGIREGPGVVEVAPADEPGFLRPLPIRALWGVGPVTATRLEGLGVRTVGDLAALPSATLERHLGNAQGAHLSALSRGIDDRPVVPVQEAKSIGHEETFPSDLWDPDTLHRHLGRMVEAASSHLRDAGLVARTVTVKLRFGDFTLITRSHTLARPVDSAPAVGAVAGALFDTVDLARGVRLLGVSLSGFTDLGVGTQLTLALDDPDGHPDAGPGDGPLIRAHEEALRLQDTWGGITEAVDAIRARYGRSSVGPASLVGASGLRVGERGEAQWGPPAPPGGEPPDRRSPAGSG